VLNFGGESRNDLFELGDTREWVKTVEGWLYGPGMPRTKGTQGLELSTREWEELDDK
jgi:hypothetical protein